jgi:hypothetical protein
VNDGHSRVAVLVIQKARHETIEKLRPVFLKRIGNTHYSSKIKVLKKAIDNKI